MEGVKNNGFRIHHKLEVQPVTKQCDECRVEVGLAVTGANVTLCPQCAVDAGDVISGLGPPPSRIRNKSQREKPPKNKDKPHHSSSRLQLKVYRRDNFTCLYCGESDNLSVDHIDPNGGDDMNNLATACRSCNSSKGSRTPEEAGMEIVDGGDPRE